MLLLSLFLIFKIILPVIKWNMSYDVSDIDTPEKAIEYYFDAINEKNPKKEMTIYPIYGDDTGMFKYSLSTLLWCKLENIEYVFGEGYVASYDIGFLFGEPEEFGMLYGEKMVFNVDVDSNNGNYYIVGMYPFGV